MTSDAQHANSKQTWLDLGSPEYPSRAQLAAIEQAAQLTEETLDCKQTPTGGRLHFSLPAHGVALVQIKGSHEAGFRPTRQIPR